MNEQIYFRRRYRTQGGSLSLGTSSDYNFTCIPRSHFDSVYEKEKKRLMPLYFYFLLTICIELPLVAIFFRHQWQRALFIGFLLNLFTWPLLQVFIFETSIDVNILELLIVITEAVGYFIFMKCKLSHAFFLSLFVNFLSYAIGLFIQNIDIISGNVR